MKRIIILLVLLAAGASIFWMNSSATRTFAQGPNETPTPRDLDYVRIEKLFKDVEFDYPFPAQVRQQTGPFGAAVKLGYLIMVDTHRYAPEYVGDNLTCTNCHLGAGTVPYAAPLWAAVGNYPAYRTKNQLVNTYQMRLQGCFENSMNGTAPPTDHKVMVALTAYSYWLAQGAPIGVSLKGRGMPKLPALAPNVERGGKLYDEQCALCHGADGQGTRTRGATGYVFPPLWGSDAHNDWLGPGGGIEGQFIDDEGSVSFNWGAGLAKVQSFAGFIKYNMPLGQGGTLSDQDATDIAAWVLHDAHPRPTKWHR
jgi:thiosulfate dehydrogenase